MSRIGRLPVVIPQGVTVTFTDGVATVKGPLGTLSEEIKGHINLEIKGNEAIFTRVTLTPTPEIIRCFSKPLVTPSTIL